MKYTKQYNEYQQLKEIIWKGIPDHREELANSSKQYGIGIYVHHSLTVDDDLIVYSYSLLIPSQMHRQVL